MDQVGGGAHEKNYDYSLKYEPNQLVQYRFYEFADSMAHLYQQTKACPKDKKVENKYTCNFLYFFFVTLPLLTLDQSPRKSSFFP